MKSLCLIHRSIGKQRKLTEHEYHKHRPRKVLFSEHVYFVQICPVFAGPVTYYVFTCIHIYVNMHIQAYQSLDVFPTVYVFTFAHLTEMKAMIMMVTMLLIMASVYKRLSCN